MELKKGDNFLKEIQGGDQDIEGKKMSDFPTTDKGIPMEEGLEDPAEVKLLKGVSALYGGYSLASAIPGITGLVERLQSNPDTMDMIADIVPDMNSTKVRFSPETAEAMAKKVVPIEAKPLSTGPLQEGEVTGLLQSGASPEAINSRIQEAQAYHTNLANQAREDLLGLFTSKKD